MAKMGSGPALGAVGGPGGHRGAAGLVGGPGLQDNNALLDKAKMRENTIKKWLRVGTVGAYLFFVSLTAIVLAIYYGLFWEHQGQNQKNETDTGFGGDNIAYTVEDDTGAMK